MYKRIISLCLSLVLLLCLLPAAAPTAAAEGDVAIDDTNFPDEIFRRCVKQCDRNHDGVLSQWEIAIVTMLDAGDFEITSLKGIEYFTALTELYCEMNLLTELDVSKNTALKELYCSQNQLTALNVRGCSELSVLGCDDNQLTTLDVSNNTWLKTLTCNNNQLTELDVSKNAFLTILHCTDNRLTALEWSKYTWLKTLDCSDNQLNSLDVSKNTNLTSLGCANNQLTALDLSKNQELNSLTCYGNNLTVLDISAVPNLAFVRMNGTKSVNEEKGFVQYTSSRGYLAVDIGQAFITYANPFVDVKETDFFYDAVLWAVNHEPLITTGTSTTKFSPGKDCTREQVVTFLWRALACPEPTNTQNPFQDVPADAYYTKAVLWAVENGITTGKSKTKFGVGDPCNRAQVVTFLWRAKYCPEPTITQNPFKDVPADAYYTKAVLWAVEKGITKGTSKTKFSPDQTCNRGQVVTFLYRDMVGVK